MEAAMGLEIETFKKLRSKYFAYFIEYDVTIYVHPHFIASCDVHAYSIPIIEYVWVCVCCHSHSTSRCDVNVSRERLTSRIVCKAQSKRKISHSVVGIYSRIIRLMLLANEVKRKRKLQTRLTNTQIFIPFLLFGSSNQRSTFYVCVRYKQLLPLSLASFRKYIKCILHAWAFAMYIVHSREWHYMRPTITCAQA